MYYSIIGKKRMTTWMSDVTKKKETRRDKNPNSAGGFRGRGRNQKNKIMRRKEVDLMIPSGNDKSIPQQPPYFTSYVPYSILLFFLVVVVVLFYNIFFWVKGRLTWNDTTKEKKRKEMIEEKNRLLLFFVL